MTVYATGVDFAYGEGVTVAQLKDAGVQFVCRYLSGGSSKDITASELDNYLVNGINVVLNWETSGQMPSQAQGVRDAQGAQAEVNRLAQAVQVYSAKILAAPIIFSADFDPTAAQLDDIVAYMTGVESVLGKARTGVYGGVATINAVAEAGVASYFWQTTAWSDGEVSPHTQLYQMEYNYFIGPANTDKDEALAENYGYIGAAAPTPPSPPAPTPGLHWVTSPLVEEGNTGVIVEVVQYLLLEAGAELTVDGDFGPATLAAVKAFQTSQKISPTGEIHGYTWPYLVVTVQNGTTGNAVDAVQVALNSAEDAGLTVDGDDGAATTAAVESFQTKSKLTVDGIVGQNTWNALVNAVLATPAPPTPAPTPVVVSGSAQENANTLAKFLTENGYSNNGAAGVIVCCWGESELNPESVGDGGGGLIGWTPLPEGYVTGDADKDLEKQMAEILVYNNQNDAEHIATLNAQTSVQAAADYYSQVFERPAVTDSDVHAEGISIAEAAIASL